MNDEYDVSIVGAGIVGLTFANLLAESGLNILVIDSKPPLGQLTLPNYPMRVSAINLRTQKIFTQLKLWTEIINHRVSPYRCMSVWDSEGQGEITFDSADIGKPELGHIIENDVIIYNLFNALREKPQVTIAAPLLLTAINVESDGVILQTEKQPVKTQLVVGADGANSWVRQQLAIELAMRAYEHKAIVATVNTEQEHQMTAWQRFLPTGPLAFLPLSVRHQCSIVWSCVPDKADDLLSLNDDDFCMALTQAFDGRLGDVKKTGPRAAFPLYMRHAKTYTQERVALIGDAAHTIHPLAGQGVNLGIADANELAKVIIASLKQRQPYSKHAILRRYERARKGENTLMIYMMDSFKQLFSSELNIVKSLRNAGLSFTNRITPLKNKLMQLAMGAS